MRVALALMLIAAACSGTTRSAERLEEPALWTFAGYRPETQGCIYGDCLAGEYARRVGDRTISGTVGTPGVLIEWERGACAGWTYRGAADADLPHGPGTLTPRRGPFVSVTGRFAHGVLAGHAEAIALVADDDKPNAVSGELMFDPAVCVVHFDPAELESSVIADLVYKSAAGVNRASFRGIVGVDNEQLVPVRGVMVDASGRASTSGYFELEIGERIYVMTERAVCLAARCANGHAAEHRGGGERFELVTGTFTHGVRAGRATVYRVDPIAGSIQLDGTYAGGELLEARVVRKGYTIVERIPDLAGFGDRTTHSIEGLGPTLIGIEWSLFGGFTRITTGDLDGAATAIRGVPAEMDGALAVIAAIAQELDRRPGARECLTCTWFAASVSSPPEHVAVVDGPRTPVVAMLEPDVYVTMIRRERSVLEVWLPDHRQWMRSRSLWLSLADTVPTLTGGADLIRDDGSQKPVVLYRGRRIDPLGFNSVSAFERATDRDIAARAKRWAKTAATARARNEKASAALRRIAAGIGVEQSQLANARTQIAGAATDAPGYERVIRSAHVAVELASDAVLDARYGVDAALARLGDDDPTRDSVAALGAFLRDHDERLRILVLAFDAFEYSDDVDRLASVRTALADDLAAFPIAALANDLAELRAIVAGGPGPVPDKRSPEPEAPRLDVELDADEPTP